MPILGEIKTAIEIGHKGKQTVKFIFTECEDCHKYRWNRLVKGKPRNKICHHCACLRGAKTPKDWMMGDRNHQWKGGKYKNNQGYITTRVPRDSFFWNMTQKNKHKAGQGVVLEHRLFMARHLNRCLLPWEVVHHKNGIKDDNRLENLQLISSTQHLPDTESKALIKRLLKENESLKNKLKYSY